MTKIELCKSVLEQVNNLKLDTYSYCGLPTEDAPVFNYDCFTDILGALFLSHCPDLDVSNLKKVYSNIRKVYEVSILGEIFRRELQQYFSLDELLLMEACYEQGFADIIDYVDLSSIQLIEDEDEEEPTSFLSEHIEFGADCDSKKDRLIKIMNFIIEHGEFNVIDK